MIPAILHTDFYKTDHGRQYPEGTTKVYSNLTPRISRMPNIKHVVVFGIQYFIQSFVIERFNETFFLQPKERVIAQYQRRMDNALGKGAINTAHLDALHTLGYLPLEIKALPEGTLCPLKIPVLTITNTDPRFAWLPNFLETVISDMLWHPMTAATIAFAYREVLESFAHLTSDEPEMIEWQAHDFSMRGQTHPEAAFVSGGAHLLSFTGTDTVAAIDFLEKYYGANSDTEIVGGSIPATEHSVMCLGGQETEFETYERLITKVYPKGMVSIVSDTWNYWDVLNGIIRTLKPEILARDGKVVIRPDSGDPVKIICGDPEAEEGSFARRGTVEILWEIFGGKVNSKRMRQLDPHIGVIYGDSITLDRCSEICAKLAKAGFASTNVVFGIGSYTYQYVTRDTFGFAMKATYGEINGEPKEIFKDPLTDGGVKRSAKGLLCVNSDMTLSECVTKQQERLGLLQTVFLNGVPMNETTLHEIRERIDLAALEATK